MAWAVSSSPARIRSASTRSRARSSSWGSAGSGNSQFNAPYGVGADAAGDVYVAEALRRTGFPFGGEPSGTFIFPKETFCPDGVYAAALLAKYAQEQRLSEMIDSLPSYPRARESFVFPAANRGAINEKMAQEMAGVSCNRLITVDGFRAEFNDGWYLMRLSGTEPKLRISVEARSKDELDRLIDWIAVSPDRFPVFDSDLRRAIFRRFPFYVVFRADDATVVVFAVAHGKRRPRYWRCGI